jgi:alpha-L-rhamnosidase
LNVPARSTDFAGAKVQVDVSQPSLSWQGADGPQTAYEVALSDGRRVVWDSDKVSSPDETDIPYGGPALASNSTYSWSVRVWNAAGRASAWSRPATFETALLSPSDWSAQWIGRDDPATPPALGQQAPAPLLRKDFALGRDVASARLHVAGLGYYVAWIDGHRVGNQVLDPGPTQYGKGAVYRSFDVTDLVRAGRNAIRLMLGRGYFGESSGDTFGWGASADRHEPRLLAQLDVRYRDGSTARVVSDGSWQMADGPLTDDLYFGEHYDARREQPGWTHDGFHASAWTPAPVQASPTERLTEATADPVRVTDTLQPVTVTSPAAGVRVYDFGGQYAGWARIGVRGAAGTTVTLTYGETLNSDGTVFKVYSEQTHIDAYTLSGHGLETWEPNFTRHPLRYIQVSFSPSAPAAFSIQARVNHSDVAPTGTFDSSNGLLDRIESDQRHTVLDNLWDFPTDTPWRDRQGWTADAWLYLDSAIDNFGMQRFYQQWLQSCRDAQRADGGLPVVIPSSGTDFSAQITTDPSWSGTFILDAWKLYQYYGDRSFVSDNYATAKRWMDLMATTIAKTGGVYAGFSFGDWAAPGSEQNGTTLAPPEGPDLTNFRIVPLVTANGDLYQEARTLADMARVAGNVADAASYDALADRIKQAFNQTFFDPSADTYQTSLPAGYRQTSNLVPLYYGLVPAGHEQAVYDNLVADIHARGEHLNTGAIGTKMLLRVLTAHGDTDLAYRIATQTTYPSWGYWVSQGANSSWETWSHADPGQSLDHAFLSTINDWLYYDVAGLQPAAPGFAKILVRPAPPTGLEHAAATLGTPRGPVASSWRRIGNELALTVEIPGNTTAEVDVPVTGGGAVHVIGHRGTQYQGTKSGYATYTVGPGRHTFVATQ